jgi:branched-chain amino acid transport system permease protein
VTDLENALTGVLLLGGVYGLLSLGLVMIFRATSVLNIAAGEIGLVGAYLVFAFNSVFGSFYVSLLVGVAVAALVGAVIYAVILAPVSGGRASVGASTDVAALVATIVLAQLLDAGVALIAGSSPVESRRIPR